MTREKAIEILKEIIEEGWLISDMEKCTAIEACEMGIQAIEENERIKNNMRKMEEELFNLLNPIGTVVVYNEDLLKKLEKIYILENLKGTQLYIVKERKEKNAKLD